MRLMHRASSESVIRPQHKAEAAVWRYVVALVSTVIVLLLHRQRAPHDFIAGTVVIQDRPQPRLVPPVAPSAASSSTA